MKLAILYVFLCSISQAYQETINLPGYSTKTTEVKIPEEFLNTKNLELNIELSDPDPEDGTRVVCGSHQISGQTEVDEELAGTVILSILESSEVYTLISEIKIYSGKNKQCVMKKHCLEQKYFSNGKSVQIKITSSLPYEQTIKFTLQKCPGDYVLVATLVVSLILLLCIAASVFLFKKYPKLCSKDGKTKNDPEKEPMNMNEVEIEVKIQVLNPKTNEVEKEKYTDYEVRLANSFHDDESGIRKRFVDFKLLRDELEKAGKVNLPTLPSQDVFEEDNIENQLSVLEEFINKIYTSFALTEKCVQMFIHKSTIDSRMIGQFNTETKMNDCEDLIEFQKALGINPRRVRNTNVNWTKHTQTISTPGESEILILTNPNTELGGRIWGWTACGNSPSFQPGKPFKETTIYGRDTNTTARIENKKLIKTQVPEDSRQLTTVETREMVNKNTMKMEVAIPEKPKIKCEFIYTRVSEEENFDHPEEPTEIITE